MSNYLRNAIYNATLRNTAYTPPTTVYVALYTSDPTAADAGTEVSVGGYVRQIATFAAPTNGSGTNSTNIVFPAATVAQGTITHIGIRDALTSGNLLYYGPINTVRITSTNDQLTILSGTLTDTLT